MKKVYDERKGYGEVIEETAEGTLVRWDCSPWFPEWIPKEG